jgi:fibronectin-binding autotransporter adhesin
MRKARLSICHLAVVAFLVTVADGADLFWDGGSANIPGNGNGVSEGGAGTWNLTIENWDQGDGLPHVAYPNLAGDTAAFGGTAGIVLVGGNYNGSIDVTSGGYTFEMNGDNTDANFSGLVTVAASGITKFVNANNPSGFWNYAFNGGLTIPTGGTAEVRAGGNASNARGYIASLSGGGDLTLYTSNTTLGHRVAGDNTGYSGDTTVFSGLTRLENNNALGIGGTVTLTGGTLNLNGKTATNPVVLNGGILAGNGGTLSGVVSESGGARGLTVASSLALTNANTYSGGTTLTAGTLAVGNDAALGGGAVALNGGTLDVNGTTLANDIALGGGGVSGNGGTLAGVVSGSGALVVASNLTLTNANTYSGGTTLTAATLSVGNDAALGGGAVTLSGGSLSASGGAREIANAVTIDGGLTLGPGGLTLGPGGLTLTGPVTLAGSSQWEINAGVNAGQALTITGGITGTGGMRRGAGNGSLTLGGDSDFSGGFTWASGSVASFTIASDTALGTGTFTQAGGNARLFTGDTDVALTNNNVIELSNNFSFDGPNNLDLGTGAVTINNDRVITVNSDTLTIGGSIGDGGNGYGLTKAGNGTLALSGTSSYTGTTVVSAGTLLHTGRLAGNLDIGGSGTLGGGGTIDGSLDLALGADLIFGGNETLVVNGSTVSFGGFSLANLIGLDDTVAAGTYTLIGGTAVIDFTNVGNLGLANAGDIGGGKSAYFQSGSL